MNLKLSLFLTLFARCSASGHDVSRALEADMTIYAGFITAPVESDEVLRGASALYSGPDMAEEIGSMALACPVIPSEKAEVFNPCFLYFYFFKDGLIEDTEDAIMADGWSIIANVTDFTQQPFKQDFAITGGLGQYVAAEGYIENDLLINPGLNTFSVYMNGSTSRRRVEEIHPHALRSVPGRRLEDTMTIYTGYISLPPTVNEVVRGSSPMWSDAEQTNQIGTFGLSCSLIPTEGLASNNPCMLYFYFHDEDGGIENTKNAMMATGWSVIANQTDFSLQPYVQKFAITGGLGDYVGATGYMVNDNLANPGINVFTVYTGEPAADAPLNLERDLQPDMIIHAGFVPEQPTVETLNGASAIWSDGTQAEEIGSFALACFVIPSPKAQIYNPCFLYMYFHEAGIETTEDAIIATGWSIIGNVTDLSAHPFLQEFAIIGGLGNYVGAKGYIVTDFEANPGINTFGSTFPARRPPLSVRPRSTKRNRALSRTAVPPVDSACKLP